MDKLVNYTILPLILIQYYNEEDKTCQLIYYIKSLITILTLYLLIDLSVYSMLFISQFILNMLDYMIYIKILGTITILLFTYNNRFIIIN
ncbi:hypothetical protein [Alphaentomopoxvirus acuprea]|uniref:Uncharacterized protein n=1 Tax=Alphaentomopoxvirus acuprea TaxID=62099 RepID=W6JIU3_9POXV|nr:hypothetical protein BA82_gp107 [Anomala cuprea entomopoxvirus]BAO49467.1 hypothetical protein [Anomala cuprea entomopoxvirus]